MHAGPNLSALPTPVQLFTGCGSRQRKSPTGGAPNGIPLKLRTPSFGDVFDSRTPLAIFTRSAPVACSAAAPQRTTRLATVNMLLITRWQKNITALVPGTL